MGMLGTTSQALSVDSGYQHELAVLKKSWGWLEDVHGAALNMKNSMETDPADKRLHILPEVYNPALRRAKRYLNYARAAYQGLPPPLPDSFAPPEMYAWFVHDIQAVERGSRISQDFLVIRSIELPAA